MAAASALEDQVAALDRGDGVLDLDDWIVVQVAGTDAITWLNDLITADVERLSPGTAGRSFLLDPTGRIRADLVVCRLADRAVLLQSPGQPRSVDGLLEPYVLSSDVELTGRTDGLEVRPAPGGPWAVSSARAGGTGVGDEAFDSWRIRRGIARFPVDLDEGSLPAEAGLDDAPVVDRSKGCYLGQESVAKVRNLGHPTRVVVPVRASQAVAPGQEVLVAGASVGLLTSVDLPGGGADAIARIRWAAREGPMETGSGARLEPR